MITKQKIDKKNRKRASYIKQKKLREKGTKTIYNDEKKNI
jgi:hypothetical protein